MDVIGGWGEGQSGGRYWWGSVRWTLLVGVSQVDVIGEGQSGGRYWGGGEGQSGGRYWWGSVRWTLLVGVSQVDVIGGRYNK